MSGLKLRTRLLLAYILFAIISLGGLGFAVVRFSINTYTEKFLEQKLSVARGIARSIDGDVHSLFTNAEAVNLPEYKRYYKMMRGIWDNEKYITYLYTINIHPETKEITYAVDPYNIRFDTIWVESGEFAFEIFLDEQGRPAILYDFETKTTDFSIPYKGKEYKFSFLTRSDVSEVKINDVTLFRIPKGKTINAVLPDGSLISPDSREGASEGDFGNGKTEITYYLSLAGEPASEPGFEFRESEEEVAQIRKIAESGKDFVEPHAEQTLYGNLLNAYAPIRNQDGKITGMVIIDVNDKELRNYINSILYNLLYIFAGLLLLAVLIGWILAKNLTRPLDVLSGAVRRIAGGDYSTKVDLKNRHDEFGMLAESFNQMVDEVDRAYGDLRKANDSFARFVPKEFLQQLGRETITQIELGDHVEREMTVLFSDIRNFTTISESMNPKQNFTFVNEYLGQMGPIIRKHNGFIDKYIGDAIMALFPGDPGDAVLAAAEMQNAIPLIQEKLREQGIAVPLAAGVGIHSGHLMMGTVGETARIDGTVISDVVNVASRLESLNKKMGSSVLISETVYQHLKRNDTLPNELVFRHLGLVKVKGKNTALSVYEILNPSDPAHAGRCRSLGEFGEALKSFMKGNYEEALTGFRQLTELDPLDTVSAAYIKNIMNKSDLETV